MCLGGMHVGGCACPGVCMPHMPPPTEFLTHACENITFPQLLLRAVKIMKFSKIDVGLKEILDPALFSLNWGVLSKVWQTIGLALYGSRNPGSASVSIELRGIVESLANNMVSTLRANKKSWIRLCFEFCNEVNGIAACLIRFVMLMHVTCSEQVSRAIPQ